LKIIIKLREAHKNETPFQVEQVMPHEGYNYNLDNNIAALRLKRSIEFDDFVQPACLPEPSMDLEDDSIGKVSINVKF
jgi:hypothetical protein